MPDEAMAEVHIAGGLVGFPTAERFTLVEWGGDGSPFSLMQPVDEQGPEFVVVPPTMFFPDYEPEVDDDSAERLGLSSADDALVLVIVTLGDTAKYATANLLGPLVMNRHTYEGAQVVLATDAWTTREPLFAAPSGSHVG
jgi:flagellar assembly factor FliW